jgi:hypothetical protein
MEANPQLDFAIFPSLMFERTPHDLGLWWNIDKPEDELGRQFKQDAICQGTGVLWRKDSFQRVGMWDEALAIWQDIDLFFRAYIQGYRYEKFFQLPPDLHNRVNPASLSRRAFYAPEKTLSRAKVVRRAVDLLKAHGMAHRVGEARAMVAEIVSGAARSNDFATARDLLRWAADEGVLSRAEYARLSVAVLARQTRLSKVPAVARWLACLDDGFRQETTLGKLSYQPGVPNVEPPPTREPLRRATLSNADQ